VLDLTSESEAAIPSTLVQLWQPVLYLINKLQLTTQLLDLLASHLSEVGDLCDCLSAGWITRIITAIINYGMSVISVGSSLIFIYSFIVVGALTLASVSKGSLVTSNSCVNTCTRLVTNFFVKSFILHGAYILASPDNSCMSRVTFSFINRLVTNVHSLFYFAPSTDFRKSSLVHSEDFGVGVRV